MRLEQCAEALRSDRRGIAADHQHVALEPIERRAGGRRRVSGPTRLLLDGDGDPVERFLRPGRSDDEERVGPERAGRLDHPVDEPPAEQRMEVLRRLRPHARAEPCGENYRCELGLVHSWGARIRTWDRGTKTRCLTTWLRPTTVTDYRGTRSGGSAVAVGKQVDQRNEREEARQEQREPVEEEGQDHDHDGERLRGAGDPGQLAQHVRAGMASPEDVDREQRDRDRNHRPARDVAAEGHDDPLDDRDSEREADATGPQPATGFRRAMIDRAYLEG